MDEQSRPQQFEYAPEPILTNRSKVLYGIIAIVVLAIIAFLAAYISSPSEEKANNATLPAQLPDDLSALRGTVLLTLRGESDNYPTLHEYDIETGELTKVLDNGDINITQSFASNARFSAYAALSSGELASVGNGSAMQIYVSDRETGERRAITESLNPALKRSPKWSPDGSRIVFNGRNELLSGAGVVTPDSWGIYVIDVAQNGSEQFVTAGMYPEWSPSGEKLLLLRSDGVHLFDFNTQLSTTVLEVENGTAYSNMKIGLSPDGTKLAWTNAEQNETVILDILSWEPFEWSIKQRFASRAFWPVFSEDGRYLLTQEIDWGAKDPNSRLVVYNLETFERERILDLSGYVQEQMFITDWQYE
jgi:Tol biopolymer transport system component